ncbi:hypothetical protein ABZS66_11460 [Dactylosporangium sp. NPDC005572]|uniref:hypothetical protein n=1 Tax=Dactylosporangium sp. NPDC005572 TaxID=3156889 RepID=UPI0033BAD15C
MPQTFDGSVGRLALRQRFGALVAELVDWAAESAGTGRGDNLERLWQALAEAIDVKIADRLSNVQRLQGASR